MAIKEKLLMAVLIHLGKASLNHRPVRNLHYLRFAAGDYDMYRDF